MHGIAWYGIMVLFEHSLTVQSLCETPAASVNHAVEYLNEISASYERTLLNCYGVLKNGPTINRSDFDGEWRSVSGSASLKFLNPYADPDSRSENFWMNFLEG